MMRRLMSGAVFAAALLSGAGMASAAQTVRLGPDDAYVADVSVFLVPHGPKLPICLRSYVCEEETGGMDGRPGEVLSSIRAVAGAREVSVGLDGKADLSNPGEHRWLHRDVLLSDGGRVGIGDAADGFAIVTTDDHGRGRLLGVAPFGPEGVTSVRVLRGYSKADDLVVVTYAHPAN